MKRRELAHLLGKKVYVEGTFSKYGLRGFELESDKSAVTMLFTDVRIGDTYLDHVWVKDNKQFRKKNIREGSIVRFQCEVERYSRGYCLGKKRFIQVMKKGRHQNLSEFLERIKKFNSIELISLYKDLILEKSKA